MKNLLRFAPRGRLEYYEAKQARELARLKEEEEREGGDGAYSYASEREESVSHRDSRVRAMGEVSLRDV